MYFSLPIYLGGWQRPDIIAFVVTTSTIAEIVVSLSFMSFRRLISKPFVCSIIIDKCQFYMPSLAQLGVVKVFSHALVDADRWSLPLFFANNVVQSYDVKKRQPRKL
jgi:hypothetical protein